MLTEIKYRTFDELLDSVKIDLQSYDLEGAIDTQSLIKVAARVSYELGLKINPSRSRCLEVSNNRVKLPNDFYVLNFALLCDGKRYLQYPFQFPKYKTYCQGVVDGYEFVEDLIRASMKILYTETLDIVPGNNLINHGLCTQDYIVQAINTATGAFLEFDIAPNPADLTNSFYIVSNAVVTVPAVKVTILGGDTYDKIYNMFMDLNPCNDGTVLNPCSNQTFCPPTQNPLSCPDPCVEDCSVDLVQQNGQTCVTCSHQATGARWEYGAIIPLHIDKCKSLSADSFNIITRSKFAGMLKNGFLETNFCNGTLYINYQSTMEDDKGNLLVMSHELVDEFYEYALKQRILENLYLSGDVKAGTALQLIEARLRAARNNAVSFVNTPDFHELKKTWEMNRKAMYSRYYDMFKSYPPYNPYYAYPGSLY